MACAEELASTGAFSPVGGRWQAEGNLESHVSFEGTAAVPGQIGTLSLERAGLPQGCTASLVLPCGWKPGLIRELSAPMGLGACLGRSNPLGSRSKS